MQFGLTIDQYKLLSTEERLTVDRWLKEQNIWDRHVFAYELLDESGLNLRLHKYEVPYRILSDDLLATSTEVVRVYARPPIVQQWLQPEESSAE